MRKKHDYVKNW